MTDSTILESLTRIASNLFYIIPTILFIGIAIYYLINSKDKTAGVLILIGNILILLVTITHSFLFKFYQDWGGELFAMISLVINGISFIGSILFVIGFYIIVKKGLSKQI